MMWRLWPRVLELMKLGLWLDVGLLGIGLWIGFDKGVCEESFNWDFNFAFISMLVWSGCCVVYPLVYGNSKLRASPTYGQV